ncbi:AraC family transcriptional regulator [Streptomyces olivaceus]|uniref:AraC family transcriptional regulator n=1 Tax=Streptomyces olivaceus TaxID=47716 RepID=UPI001CC99B98|nr:AraC family transcriptional regulator [Streptomyces olivaceus]MBZ6080416.1 AraC family transcriptional regulator [Streptomyces olivaceus]
MDLVDTVLSTMSIRPSRYARLCIGAPWGISVRSRGSARLLLVAEGSCWLGTKSLDEPQLLVAGDCCLVQSNVEFTLQDAPGRALADCESLSETHIAEHGGDGKRTVILSGRFSFDIAAAGPLFGALPPLLRIDLDNRAGRSIRATFDMLDAEASEGGGGSALIASRLADVLFVQAMRACCASIGTGGVSWLAAMRDPQLSAAMNAMHADLTHPWTVAELARVAGMSRSAFAAAFHARAGETPLSYLTSWRLYRAKTLLRDTPLSIQEIAVRVGYETGTALSRAFTRRECVSPGAWRKERRRPQAA